MSPFRYRHSWFLVLLASAGISSLQAATLPAWTLEIDSLTYGETQASGVRIQSGAEPGANHSVSLNIDSLLASDEGMSLGPLTLTCPGSIDRVLGELCASGAWRAQVLPDWPPLEGNLAILELGDSTTRLGARGRWESVRWEAEVTFGEGAIGADVSLPAQPVSNLDLISEMVPPLAWVGAGQVEGQVVVNMAEGAPPRAQALVNLRGIDFDSPDGLYAGLGVDLRLDADIPNLGQNAGDFEATIEGGELLLHDFYRDFSDAAIRASGHAELGDEAFQLSGLRIADDGSVDVQADLSLPLEDPAALAFNLDAVTLQFPEAYRRYLESVVAVYSLDGLSTGGVLRWRADEEAASNWNGTLELEQVGIEDTQRERFAITGLDGRLSTGADSVLTWEGASLVKMDLGAGEAHLGVSRDSLELRQPLTIPLFGGQFVLQALSVGMPGNDVADSSGGEAAAPPIDIVLNAALDKIDMQQMSAALGWPEFAGTLSGRIPGVNWSGDVLEIEGDLDFNVFDGNVVLSDLRIERLFGVLPSLAANITASSLDLQLLTQTFEFGRIAGRIDGYVRNLRMLDWEPVRFDAWFGTPDDSQKNDISRQAVRHLTEIGGGSPTAMLSGPVLRLFNDFSYRRIGLGCVLRDNICQIRGVEDQGDAVLLLEGAGIPKISILAYNRQVDWPQFVAELSAATSGEEVRIGN